MQDEKRLIDETECDFFQVTQLWELDTVRRIARHAVKLGYRKERETELVLDTEFESKTKVRYRCRECGYWHTVKAQNADNLLKALRYCSSCGARIIAKIVGEEDKQ
ncbi:MAG: hypothetical protein J6S14_04905 [Clostridia bacterium]|nr:hypothetical protein [Clostridia bacterium]